MTEAFNHLLVELDGIATHRLADADTLSAVVVAAAGAVGIPAHGPPVVHRSAQGIAVGLLGLDGHIVLHTSLPRAICLVDIVGRAPTDVAKAVEVIRRRLTGEPR